MSGKVAIVTGGSRGIGAAIAVKLGKDGYRVIIHYRTDDQKAQQVCSEIDTAMAVKVDLSEDGACEELIKEVKSKFGQIDVLVNNAGLAIDQILPMAKPADFDRLLRVNLRPVFLLSKLASKEMIKKKSGSIINITSVVGHTGNAGQSMYAATKGAITAFTKSAALDLGRFGIRANCVAPGYISTEMTSQLPENVRTDLLARIPLERLGTVHDVAEAVSFLASDSASYITGSTIHVNGGLFPN